MSDAVLRPFRKGDEAAINDGFNRTFGARRTLDDWHWKYPAEPEGRWVMLATTQEGALLAHYGAVASRFRCGTVTVRAGQITDAYAVPEVQGKRVFTDCYEEFIRAFGRPGCLPLMYGFPNVRHYGMGLKVLKYVPLGPVPCLRHAGRRGVLLPPWSGVKKGFDRGAVDDLWRRAEQRYPFGNQRDGAWIGRRYGGRPGVEYVHLSVWRGGCAEAWGVVREMGERLFWIELVWDGVREGALAVLSRSVVKLARRRRLPVVEMWLRGDAAAEAVLAGNGWQRRPEVDAVRAVARTFQGEVDLDAIGAGWYVTAGDSDLA